MLAVVLLSSAINATAGIIYVKAGSTGSGTSWANAYGNLQDALAAAGAGDQIWVAAGTYVPTTDPGFRNGSFHMKSGVGIYGGFAGTETLLSARDSTGNTNITILSGEIQGDGNLYNNCYNVVHGNTDSTATLNSFTITQGCANDTLSDLIGISGGGIINYDANPTYANLKIINNYGERGGGMANYDGSPVIRNVSFIRDTGGMGGALYHNHQGLSYIGEFPYSTDCMPVMQHDSFAHCKGNFGGALCLDQGSNGELSGIVFFENYSDGYGGAMVADAANFSISHSAFISNAVRDTSGPVYGQGGALFCDGLTGQIAELHDVLFAKNYGGLGGAILYQYTSGSGPSLNNVTFSGNTAVTGTMLIGHTFLGNTICSFGGNMSLRNCIMDSTDNGNAMIDGSSAGAPITYMFRHSMLAGNYPAGTTDSGGNLLHADPLFTDTAAYNYQLLAASPAINAGDNTFATDSTDLAGNTRISGGTVDMGAYEFHAMVAAVPAVLNDDQISVYPNPASNALHINAPYTINACILDMAGRMLVSKEHVTGIDISSLTPATYLLQVTNENGTVVKTVKIIKTR